MSRIDEIKEMILLLLSSQELIKSFFMRGKPEYVEILKSGSVEVVNLSNKAQSFGRALVLQGECNVKNWLCRLRF